MPGSTASTRSGCSTSRKAVLTSMSAAAASSVSSHGPRSSSAPRDLSQATTSWCGMARPAARCEQQGRGPAVTQGHHGGGLVERQAQEPSGSSSSCASAGLSSQVGLLDLDEPTRQPHLREEAAQLVLGGEDDAARRRAVGEETGQGRREVVVVRAHVRDVQPPATRLVEPVKHGAQCFPRSRRRSVRPHRTAARRSDQWPGRRGCDGRSPAGPRATHTPPGGVRSTCSTTASRLNAASSRRWRPTVRHPWISQYERGPAAVCGRCHP